MVKHINRLKIIYSGMKSRCNNPSNKYYKYYGAKSIKICKEWENINNFIVWALTHGYANNLTIERHNNLKNYSPSNCTWVTRKEQAENRDYDIHKKQYRGVRKIAANKYIAQIQHHKKMNLGQYRTPEEAALAFNNYVINHNLNRKLNVIGSIND